MQPWRWSGETGQELHDALRHVVAAAQPRSYLEIGVDGGGSLETVIGAMKTPLERIVLCDKWNWDVHPYLHDFNHIYKVLDNCGVNRKQTSVEFRDGDSKLTVPKIRETFDLITVDGDHSAEGGAADLQNTWPLLNPGGFLVFDDIDHPVYPWLRAVFNDWIVDKMAEIVSQDGAPATTVVVRKI